LLVLRRTRVVDIRNTRGDLSTVAKSADRRGDRVRADKRRQVLDDTTGFRSVNVNMHDTVDILQRAGYVCGAVIARQAANIERGDVNYGGLICVLRHTS
jgi:hypothetical protein